MTRGDGIDGTSNEQRVGITDYLTLDSMSERNNPEPGDYLVRVHGDSIAITAEDDAAEAMWIPINKVNPAEFGLTSIRNAVIRFLDETLRK